MQENELEWRVHASSLLSQVLDNPGASVLRRPIQIFGELLVAVAERAAELDDVKLNKLMMRLAAYEVADPYSSEYDSKLVEEYLRKPDGESK